MTLRPRPANPTENDIMAYDPRTLTGIPTEPVGATAKPC